MHKGGLAASRSRSAQPATYTFPGNAFVVQGDPEAVRESARSYGRFAGIAAEAAALRALDSGGAWVGSEGDLCPLSFKVRQLNAVTCGASD
jgi:hypothetical protein